ncbi:MAG: hypothetical protein ABSF22_16390 [Bryobacteraceae bacterium]
MNDTLTSIWLVKTGLDNIPKVDANKLWADWVSPSAECFINALWLVPAICGVLELKTKAASDWVILSANGCFDVGGIIAPFAKENITGPEAAPIFFGLQEVLTLGYGVLSATSGGLILAGK